MDGANSFRRALSGMAARALAALADEARLLRDPRSWAPCAVLLALNCLAAALVAAPGADDSSAGASWRAGLQALSLAASLASAASMRYCASLDLPERSVAGQAVWAICGSLPSWILCLRAGLWPMTLLTCLALLAAAGCAWVGFVVFSRSRAAERQKARTGRLPEDPGGQQEEAPVQSAPAARTLQWMRRVIDQHGAERLHGTINVEFARGQSRANVHVAFVPPFAAVPQFRHLLEPDQCARVSACAVFPFGVRLELKRTDAASEQLLCVLRFEASMATEQSRAA